MIEIQDTFDATIDESKLDGSELAEKLAAAIAANKGNRKIAFRFRCEQLEMDDFNVEISAAQLKRINSGLRISAPDKVAKLKTLSIFLDRKAAPKQQGIDGAGLELKP